MEREGIMELTKKQERLEAYRQRRKVDQQAAGPGAAYYGYCAHSCVNVR